MGARIFSCVVMGKSKRYFTELRGQIALEESRELPQYVQQLINQSKVKKQHEKNQQTKASKGSK